MGVALEKTVLSEGEYLAWEAQQAERHEFVGGEVFAMAGADDAHTTVALNLAVSLRAHLRGTPCRTYISDMRLHVAAAGSYFYPDVMVTCSAADRKQALQKTEPTLLAEVLSPSTAAYDRGAKFAAYRSVASLQEYALIDVETRTTDLYRKGADGLWVLHPHGIGEVVTFASVELALAHDELFADLIEPEA